MRSVKHTTRFRADAHIILAVKLKRHRVFKSINTLFHIHPVKQRCSNDEYYLFKENVKILGYRWQAASARHLFLREHEASAC